jgi:hypothetical protein
LTSLGLKLDKTNLTPEQFAQLTEVLFQYQDIFCSDYENLPESRLEPYELVLTDYTPIRQRQYPLSPQQEESHGKICRQASESQGRRSV